MVKQLFVACLAFAAISAQAFQISFYSTEVDVTAIALSDGAPDFQSAVGTSDLVSVSAASIGVDVATAGSLAGGGLLSTSADVSGLGGGIVSAVATSHFLGSFVTSGSLLLLDIDFMISDFTSGTGNGGTTLFMTLTNGATTLFSDYITGSQMFSYAAAAGSAGTLELTLTSEANAGFLAAAAGGYSSTGMVNITTPVPEPETYALLAMGLLAIGFVARRRRA